MSSRLAAEGVTARSAAMAAITPSAPLFTRMLVSRSGA